MPGVDCPTVEAEDEAEALRVMSLFDPEMIKWARVLENAIADAADIDKHFDARGHAENTEDLIASMDFEQVAAQNRFGAHALSLTVRRSFLHALNIGIENGWAKLQGGRIGSSTTLTTSCVKWVRVALLRFSASRRLSWKLALCTSPRRQWFL